MNPQTKDLIDRNLMTKEQIQENIEFWKKKEDDAIRLQGEWQEALRYYNEKNPPYVSG